MRATVSVAALRRVLFGVLASVALAAGLAEPVAAVVVPFRAGRLTIRIDALGTSYSLIAPAQGTATGTVDVNRTATTLGSFTLQGGLLSAAGVTVPVTDPALQPITGLVGSFENEAGLFTSQSGTLGGTMGLRLPGSPAEPGIVGVCVIFACDESIPLEIPLSVVGVGGEEEVPVLHLTFTLAGAPWTIGTASVPVEGGEVSESGSLAVLGSGWMRVRLVTPIAIGVDPAPPGGIPAQIAAFGLLDLEIAAPEPGTAAAGATSLGTLSVLARRRRRGAQSAAPVSGARSSRCSAPSAKVATR
ncbi:MAG: hypothetical protein OZ948_14275 [Deltaproteobacteria bacterium]|nr:hypothetical protein [Deltaproteobacteria bacterium]